MRERRENARVGRAGDLWGHPDRHERAVVDDGNGLRIPKYSPKPPARSA